MSKQGNQIETPEEKRLGNKWSLISLICFVGGFIISIGAVVVSGFFLTFTNESDELSSILTTVSEAVQLVGSGVSVLASIAALVVIIYVRVKYPKNIFGKVLMWVYIVLFILYIITMAVIIIACGIACAACTNECQKLASMAIESGMIC